MEWEASDAAWARRVLMRSRHAQNGAWRRAGEMESGFLTFSAEFSRKVSGSLASPNGAYLTRWLNTGRARWDSQHEMRQWFAIKKRGPRRPRNFAPGDFAAAQPQIRTLVLVHQQLSSEHLFTIRIMPLRRILPRKEYRGSFAEPSSTQHSPAALARGASQRASLGRNKKSFRPIQR
jgi:hypothetical protein